MLRQAIDSLGVADAAAADALNGAARISIRTGAVLDQLTGKRGIASRRARNIPTHTARFGKGFASRLNQNSIASPYCCEQGYFITQTEIRLSSWTYSPLDETASTRF